jgi:hypothetical protein
MTDSHNTPDEAMEAGEPKKITLEEAIKRKLAQKKQAQQTGNKQQNQHATGVQAMKHQQTKKSNNQRRRTGV